MTGKNDKGDGDKENPLSFITAFPRKLKGRIGRIRKQMLTSKESEKERERSKESEGNPLRAFSSFLSASPGMFTSSCRWTWRNTFPRLWRWIKKKVTWGLFIPVAIGIFLAVIIFLFIAYRESSLIEITSLKEQLSSSQNVTEQIEIRDEINHLTNFWSQVWEFCKTDTFKTLGMSVLLTLLLTALGKIFKIREALEERIRAQRQTRIDNQKKCIAKTEEMWNELYRMVSEVRFYDKKAVKEHNDKPGLEAGDRKKTIDDILIQSEDFASRVEEVVNQWHFVFPILPKIGEESNKDINKTLRDRTKKKVDEDIRKLNEEIVRAPNKPSKQKSPGKLVTSPGKTYDVKSLDMLKKELKKWYHEELEEDCKAIRRDRRPSRMIVFFIKILYEAASSVAYYIKNVNIEDAIKELQNSLGVVQDVIRDSVHQYMLAILKCSVEPTDGYGDTEQLEINKENINRYIQGLYTNYIETRKRIYRILPRAAIIDEGGNLRNRLDRFLSRMERLTKPQANKEIQEINRQLEETFGRIGGCLISEDWEYKYSEETLHELAKQLSLISFKADLADRIEWLSIIQLEEKYG